MKGDEEFMVSNKVVIRVEGGIAELQHFPLDIAVCINDLDAESEDPCRRVGNRYKNLAVRWDYLLKRLDHDCDLILRLTIKKLLEIFPLYFDSEWRNNSTPHELVINGHSEWWFGDNGLRLCRSNEDITFDELETKDSFDFVQALMMDHELLMEEISKYGESYKQSRLASLGN